MLATSTRKKLEARSSGNKENAPGNSSNSNAAQTSSEVAVILALRNKIAQQAQELTTLNGEFVQCKDEKLAAERRICELLARSVVSSLPTPSQATAVTTKRRFDKEVSLKLDALEKTLNLSEQKCEELARQKRETEQRLEDKVRECGAQSRRVSELTSEMDVLKSHLEYSQRSGNPVSRANKSAAAIARSAAHVSLEENRKLRLALDQARRSSEAAKHATTERERQLQQHIAGLQEALMNKSCAAADEAHERSKNKHDVRKSKHKYEDEDENEGHKAIEELAATRGQMAAMREALEEYRCAMQTSDREKSALRAANDGLEAKLQEQREALSTVRLDNDRLHIGEAGAKLRVLEKERDVLVDYVQSETTKHAALQARAEAAESALRSSQYAEQAVMEKLKHSLTVLEAERQRREGVENRLLGMVELQATLEEARSDKLALTALCDRKSLEIEEISRMHEVLLGQLRTKEAATRELEEEARQRAGQQADLAHAKAELAALRVRMQSTDAECQAAVNKVAALEPETLQLRRELASLRPAHASQAAELERLRPAERLLSELHSDLTSLSHSASAPVDYLSRLPLSHAHSAWAAVPALRHVSAPLYDRVKAVLNDLYRKEMEAEDLKGVVAGLQRELEVARKDLGGLRRHAEERAGRAVQTLQEAQLQADEAKARAAQAERLLQTRLARVEAETKVRVDAAEAESAALRSARAALDQVRTGVRTFGVATGKHKRAIGTVQMEKEERLSDEQVAEAVCAALMSHSTTLSTLKDARANLEKEKSAGAALSAELAKANEDLMQVRGSLSALRASDKAAKAELHDANLLAEKHSAHAASLEAKVETLNKERQLRMAQIASLMTREDSMRTKLLQALQEYSYPLQVQRRDGQAADAAAALQPPPATDGMKLAELVGLTCETLARMWQGANLRAGEALYPVRAASASSSSSSSSSSSTSSKIRQAISSSSSSEEDLAGLIAAQRRHMEEEALPRQPPASLSPKRSVALEAAISSSRAVSASTSASAAPAGLTRINTPTSKSPSSQLQLRLKRAQEAFSSMRESHD